LLGYLPGSRNGSLSSKRILQEDPTQRHWFRAAKTILSIPSNVIPISASSAGYFYFTGLLAFGIRYLTQRFHINTMAASSLFVGAGLGGIGGVIASGWIADWLLRKGLITARVWVTGIAFLLTIPFFLLTTRVRQLILQLIDIIGNDFKSLHYNSVSC
jgi:Sugar phosphate permease